LTEASYQTKTIVLRTKIDEDEAKAIVNKKKTTTFRSLLRNPEKSTVHVDSFKLIYEPFLLLTGTYHANFFRKAIYTIKVPSNVREVVLGDGVFQVRKKSGIMKRVMPKGLKTINSHKNINKF
jgi:hypothetical protein